MSLIDERSLSETVYHAFELLNEKRTLDKRDAMELGDWLMKRRDGKHSYFGLPSPTDEDMQGGVKRYLGDSISGGAAKRHILGEESLRLLRCLGKDAWARELEEALAAFMAERGDFGFYCCGSCSLAFWRNLEAGGFDWQEERIRAGLAKVKESRKAEGRWQRFPFYDTLYTLSLMDTDLVAEELDYIRPEVERSLQRLRKASPFAKRRKEVLEKLLEKV